MQAHALTRFVFGRTLLLQATASPPRGRSQGVERRGDVEAAHRQVAERNGVHLQRQKRGDGGALGIVYDPERRQHPRYHRRAVLHLDVFYVLKVVRRRLALQVLVQPGALVSDWAARRVRGPAAAT